MPAMSFEQFLEPLGYPSKRIFWGYVVGALAVACVVTAKLKESASSARVAIFSRVLVQSLDLFGLRPALCQRQR